MDIQDLINNMGLLEKIMHLGTPQTPRQIPYEEQMQENDFLYDRMLGGQPAQPAQTTVIPPSLDKETMELLLIPQFPKEISNGDPLIGQKRYWPVTTGFGTTIQSANMNAHRQKMILTKLRIAKDFDGVDDVESLVQDEMLEIVAEVLTDKARSDFADGIRDRLASGVGIGMSGQITPQKDIGERPRENRALFGIFGRDKR